MTGLGVALPLKARRGSRAPTSCMQRFMAPMQDAPTARRICSIASRATSVPEPKLPSRSWRRSGVASNRIVQCERPMASAAS
jgi:hypothetical protein